MADQVAHNSDWLAVEVVDEDIGGHVAYCHHSNAPLISAAPDLLAAIKGLLDAGEYDNEGNFVIRCTKEEAEGDYPDYIEAPSIRAANLAIAKAEGRNIPCPPTGE
jgi:hypothetical protein